jgi:hypothetical protein
MIPRPDILEKRAVKAGVKASKKLHHVVTREELLAVRVQTWPVQLRLLMFLAGAGLLVAAVMGWPLEGGIARFFEGASGVLLMLFGVFGVKKTLGNLVDGLGNAIDVSDLIGGVLEAVGEAVGSIVDL